MAEPQKIKSRDLVVGGRYLHVNGLFIRQINAIEGDRVYYHDQYGKGQCSKQAFLNRCSSVASKEDEERVKREFRNDVYQPSQDEFSLRDEANALTAYAFRNGFLEDLHAGKPSPLLDEPGLSRITDEEMKKLMIEASAKVAEMLRLKREHPTQYEIFIRNYHRAYCRRWQRE